MGIKDIVHSRYELVIKFTIILFSILLFSFIFGYYWLLLENHNSRSSSLVKNSLRSYFESLENNDLLDENNVTHILDLLSRSGSSIIILNEKNVPIVWHNIHIKDDPQASLEIIKKYNDKPLVYMNKFQKRVIYYLPDDLMYKMRYYPIFLIGSILLIAIMTAFFYKFLKFNEKQSLWIAMSKETAHQLGTPITSLNGWKEYLGELSKENEDLILVQEGLSDDIKRINLVVNRFSKIASEKELAMCDINPLIMNTVNYISTRIPSEGSKFDIELKLESKTNVYVNELLFVWTIENLIKNSIEAIPEKNNGKIVIRSFEEKNKIIVEVTDNGHGITVADKNNIFKTGFTTKNRGWGLGLSLAKKVIEQYHNG
ncbi:MAG: HAMP domain-containing histidine kinase, partial [Candidatus Delongbacteria bacterium]|nr:HAMP domain-containing histidine kinase [Candidatus Delongbacteria bacterium]